MIDFGREKVAILWLARLSESQIYLILMRFLDKMKSSLIIYAVLAFIVSFSAKAEGINFECLKTFNVKDSVVNIGNISMNCIELEKIRANVYQSYEEYVKEAKKQSNDATRNYVINDIQRMEKELESASMTKEGVELSQALVGSFAATLGLSSCAETVGIGCVFAAIGFVYAKYSIISATASLEEKNEAIKELRDRLKLAEDTLGKMPNFNSIVSKTAVDFNSLCDLVKKQCSK